MMVRPSTHCHVKNFFHKVSQYTELAVDNALGFFSFHLELCRDAVPHSLGDSDNLLARR